MVRGWPDNASRGPHGRKGNAVHAAAGGIRAGLGGVRHRANRVATFLHALGQAQQGREHQGLEQRAPSEQAERTAIIAETLYRERQLGVDEIAQRLNISKVTLYKYLRHRKVVIQAHQTPAAVKTGD